MNMGPKEMSPAAALLRAIGQSLAWLPAALALAAADAVPLGSAGLWLALALGASLLGAALTIRRYLPPWIVYALLLAGAAAAIAGLGTDWLPPVLYLLVAAWLGGRPLGRQRVAYAGVALNGIVLIAAVWAEGLNEYRPLFIVSGICWVVLAAYVGHARLLDRAGLHDGIVTRLVSRSSRRYLLLLLAIVLIVYVATSDFHLWRAITEFLRSHAPKPGSPPPPPSEPAMPSEGMLPPLEQEPNREWSKWLDYAFYVLGAAIGVFLLRLLVKRFLLNRSWLRELAAWLGRRLQRLAALLRRPEPPPEPTFTDEKESLLDIGKALRQAQARWLRRSARKPLARRDWERLAAREKVRRLYEESVLTAMEAGYELRPSDTPAETLDKVERWYAQRAGGGALSAPGRWLAHCRELLAGLYGRARYGSGEASSAELEKLTAEYPWESRR